MKKTDIKKAKKEKRAKTIEEEINALFNFFTWKDMSDLVHDAEHLFKLMDTEEDDDWVEKEYGRENARPVRVSRMLYLVSRMAHRFGRKFSELNSKYPKLYLRIEEQVRQMQEDLHETA